MATNTNHHTTVMLDAVTEPISNVEAKIVVERGVAVHLVDVRAWTPSR